MTVFVYGQEENKDFKESGIHFHFIKQNSYSIFGWWKYRKFLERYLNKIIEDESIDVLEAADWTGITAFMKLKCPLVIRLHGSDSYFCKLEERSQKKKNFWFEKLALKGADHLLSVSEFTANKTAELFKTKIKIEVIPNSVDVRSFKPSDQKIIPGRILYFGSIIKKKGVLELASIFSKISKENPEANLIMAGRDVVDVQTRKSTHGLFQEKLSEDTGNRVEWKGTLSPEEIRQELLRAAVVVFPSFAEALPMAWLEAMAMEKALVTSNIGWAKEMMIDGETGFTVDPKDHDNYAEKVLTLIKDPALAERMGKAAREQVLKKFSNEVVVERNLEFYRKVVRGQRMEDS